MRSIMAFKSWFIENFLCQLTVVIQLKVWVILRRGHKIEKRDYYANFVTFAYLSNRLCFRMEQLGLTGWIFMAFSVVKC